jgi:hypothetical protein
MAEEHVGRRSALRLGGLAAIGAVGAGIAGSSLRPATVSAAGFGFTPITPYRSVDSRAFGDSGKLHALEGWDWDLWRDENSNPRIPSGAAAVTYNLTVTQTEGGGWLAVYPANSQYPGVSSINWVASGVDVANGGTVALGPSAFTGPGSVQVGCGAGGTHYIIDVTGYYS